MSLQKYSHQNINSETSNDFTTTYDDDELRQRQRARYLRDNIKLVNHLPVIYKMLSSKNDVPIVELTLTDLKLYRHETDKNVVLIGTAFYLYLVKAKFSSVLSTVGASLDTLFKNAELKPYCRWGLHAVECEMDLDDPYRVILTLLDYPVNDTGEEMYSVDVTERDEKVQMFEAYSKFDPFSGIEDDLYDADIRKENPKLFPEDNEPRYDDNGDLIEDDVKSNADDVDEETNNRQKNFAAWKHVVLQCDSPEHARMVVEEITKLTVSSVVLRDKWSRRRKKKMSRNREDLLYHQQMQVQEYEYLDLVQAAEEDEADDSDNNSDENNNQKTTNDDDLKNLDMSDLSANALKNLSPAEQRKRKREANRRRNKLAAEKQKALDNQNPLDFSQNQDSLLSGNVVTADALRLASEMRKVSALMSAEGSSDTKLLKEVMLSRLAAAEFQQQQHALSNVNSLAKDSAPATAPPDPIQLLRQHVRDNERAMEQVFSLHYEKFLTFVDKTSQLSTKTVERVHRSHDAVGHAIKSCSQTLKDSASKVVESRQALSRMCDITNLLRQRVKVSRLLETAERCVTNQSAMGLAELLHPLHDAVVHGGLPASDTLACYVITIRLPQLRQIANSFATNKLHSWLGSLRDCIVPLGDDLWKKSVDYNNINKNNNSNNSNNNNNKAQINRMSERVEHVRKRLVTIEPLKSGRPHSWKIEHSVVPVKVDDIGALFSREGTASLVSHQQQKQQSSAIDQLMKNRQENANNNNKHVPPSSLAARLAGASSSSSHQNRSSILNDLLSGNNNNNNNPNQLQTSSTPTTTQQELHYQHLNSGAFASKPGEFRGASYGRTIRRLFSLCGNEQELLTTCLDTRRLHLSTLLQSFENATEFTAKSFVLDCTKALGFLHCEELLVHEAEIDFTITHLLFVWSEIQHAIAKRARTIGKKNPPSCALLFRTLTQFKTAALGCLLMRLPECEVIDRARQEQRDSMESGMIQTITTTLQQLAQMDSLEPIELNSSSESVRKNVLQFSLHLSGDFMLPIRKSTVGENAADNAISSSYNHHQTSNQPTSAYSRFQALRRSHHHQQQQNVHKDPHQNTNNTTTTSSSRLSVLNNQQKEAAVSSLISNSKFTPFSSIVPALGDLLLGFLNECFSLGYDSGIGGGGLGANSDEQQQHISTNRVVDPVTGVMTEILDGSIHREWIDNTSLQMVQAVLRQIAAEFKMKLQQELVRSKDLKLMAVLRNNVAACRMITSILEQRYALLFHGSLNGVFEFGKPVFLTAAGNEFIRLQGDIESQFMRSFSDLISEKLAPLAHLTHWEDLMEKCQKESKGDVDTFKTRPGTNTLLVHLPPQAKNSFFHQAVNEIIIDTIKFLFNGIWPEQMVCAQARSAVCCVADLIKDNFETMLQKAEIRRAGDLLICLPLISSTIQDAVEMMMEGLNRNPDIQWTMFSSTKKQQQQQTHHHLSGPTTATSPTTQHAGLASRLLANAGAASASSTTTTTTQVQQQQPHHQDIISFPMEDLDTYFTKQGAILFERAEEYKNVANKIGANLDFATAKALKMTNFAMKNVEKLGKFATKNFTKAAGHVVSGAKEGFHFVEGVADTVSNEVKNTYRELKEEADEAGDVDFNNVTKVIDQLKDTVKSSSARKKEEEKRQRKQQQDEDK